MTSAFSSKTRIKTSTLPLTISITRTSPPTARKSFNHHTSKLQRAFTTMPTSQQKTWAAVEEYTVQHLHPQTRPNHQTLREAQANSIDKGLPDIGTDFVAAKFYALQCRALGVKHALEVGTLGAYTSIFLATENPGLKVTTVEVDPHHAEVAGENLRKAGVEGQVDIRLGPGLKVLPQLAAEINAGKSPKLGFAYIDADKENNWAYLDLILGMCDSRAVIFVDNIVRGGDLVHPDRKRMEAWQERGVKGARKVVEMVGKDDRVDGVVVQMVGSKGYDGVLMVVVK